jgi:hypothetical protein
LDDLSRRSLLFKCLTGLVYEARILYRDHGLIGKSAGEVDLTLSKWLYALASQCDHSNGFPFTQQRHP